MSSLVTKNFRVENTLNFINSISTNNYYLFFGKSDPWTNESVPDLPLDSVNDELLTRQKMIGMKKITTANVAFVVPRINWVSGALYTPYSASDSSLQTKNFYVLTDEYNVYKCLGNASGENSTIKPTGTSVNDIQTGDGYIWKFMYNIPTGLVVSFLTNEWMPVPYGSQKSLFQQSVENAAVYAPGEPIGKGHGSAAVQELFAYYLMVSEKLDGNEDGVFPVDDDFRQIGILKDPKLLNASPATAVAYRLNTTASTVDPLSGNLFYVENSRSTNRNIDQSELYQVVIEL